MGRYKSVYRPSRPPEHLVSATFDEPFNRFGIWVLRWWYGDMFKEQAGSTPDFVSTYKERICGDDLTVMERKVWGTAEAPSGFDFSYIASPHPGFGNVR